MPDDHEQSSQCRVHNTADMGPAPGSCDMLLELDNIDINNVAQYAETAPARAFSQLKELDYSCLHN